MFDIKTLFKFIEGLEKEDAINAGINELTYYKLKDNPRYIYETQSKTLIKILKLQNQKIKEHKKEMIIGIDINSTNMIVASNDNMSFVYNSNCDISKKGEQLSIKAYHHHCNSYAGNVMKEFMDALDTPPEQSRTFIIGRFNYKGKDKQNLLSYVVWRAIKKLIRDNDKIVMVDEAHSSIICPNCKHKHKKNRTNSNKFKCKNCGFKYPINDVVAASNIARYYKEGRKAVDITTNFKKVK